MEECSVKYALNILTGKWKLYIIYVLSQEKRIRFNELQRKVGPISAIMLSKNLQELEGDGLVFRKQYEEVPPHVEYSLTELGKRLTPALDALGQWGEQVFLARQEMSCRRE